MFKQAFFLASLLIAFPVSSAERDEAPLSHLHAFEKSMIGVTVPYTDVDYTTVPPGYVGDVFRNAQVAGIRRVDLSEIVDLPDGAIAVTSSFDVEIETFEGVPKGRECMKTWTLVKRLPENPWGMVFQANGFATYCDGRDTQKFSEGRADKRHEKLESEAIDRIGARFLHALPQIR